MAQYIEKELMYQKLHEAGGCDAPKNSWADGWDKAIDEAIRLLDEMPTVDVVPKSEVEKWKEINVQLHKEMSEQMTEERKIERKYVAREIFEEIERFLYLHFRFCKEEIGNDDTEYVKGRMELNTQIQNFIAELKKKYTEKIN